MASAPNPVCRDYTVVPLHPSLPSSFPFCYKIDFFLAERVLPGVSQLPAFPIALSHVVFHLNYFPGP